jgi:23S rRNA pseudouridine2605 synthase
MSSEGLILVTNDGELANRLTHPRYGVEKTYLALVAGQMPQEEIDKLREGVHLAEGVARCVSVHVRKALPQSTLVEIVLAEGKNREIRRILAKVGHKVLTLKRTAIGNVKLRDLKAGEFRRPTRDELKSLREAKPHRAPRPPRRASSSAGPKQSAAATDVTAIIDTRDRPTPGKSKRFDRRKPRREPGTGTIIE